MIWMFCNKRVNFDRSFFFLSISTIFLFLRQRIESYELIGWLIDWCIDHTQWELYIPSDLAYGDRGSPPRIGGGEVLIFQMEILAIMGDVVPALQCKIDTKERCNEKEQGYITKVQGWYDSGETTKASEQLARVQKILGSPMKDDLREWGRRRVHILEQFVEKETAEAEL